jgi:hypothetical protein
MNTRWESIRRNVTSRPITGAWTWLNGYQSSRYINIAPSGKDSSRYINIPTSGKDRIKWGRHHGMTRPQVADGGEGLQVRRLAVSIMNKQARTANKGCSSSLGVGRGATPLTVKNLRLGPELILWHDLSNWKTDMRLEFGMLGVSTG